MFLTGFFTAILIYSLIASVLTIYKDNSGYYMLGDMDIVIAGPCLWILMLFMTIFKKPLTNLYEKHKENKKRKPYKAKSTAEIEKIVLKVIKRYKKSKRNDYFNFEVCLDDYNGYYSGWNSLLIKNEKYELLNKKFSKLMNNQKKDVISVLNKYTVPVTQELMREEECDEYYIKYHCDRGYRAVR